jgi:hypothetical protein
LLDPPLAHINYMLLQPFPFYRVDNSSTLKWVKKVPGSCGSRGKVYGRKPEKAKRKYNRVGSRFSESYERNLTMQQMNSSEEQYNYGKYEGEPSYTQRPDNIYDDNFIEALAQRIVQRTPQGAQGKITGGSRNRVHPGMRLALAIVSVVMLVPLAAILADGAKGFLGFVTFGIVCAAIFLINAVFNAMS